MQDDSATTYDSREPPVTISLKRVLIDFSPEDVQRLLSIALGGDRDEALMFIRQDLAKRVEKALQGH